MSVSKTVECAVHGQAPRAYACGHLVSSLNDCVVRGINWVRDGDGHVNAWCDACNDFLDQHGGEWNDQTEAHADIKLICENCFDRLRETNPIRDWN